MGLNAVVYKNANAVRAIYGETRIKVDRKTGEIFLIDSAMVIPRELLVGTEQRLGNLDEIQFLKNEITQILENKKSFLIQKVLYSGSHSGDAIALSELASLKEEMALLGGCKDPRLERFINAMESLIQAATAEGNPIVFV